ncbi:hypothetical protein MHB44_07760 [Lysinibacillus sp. FSL H8-0500]|uniref:hypothetical protein n=1 Tax=Lysinibacillus sp. FSL H8-0500 TaxID=2921393 RepID=UPI0031015BEF
MEKFLVKEFASAIVEQSKGRISIIDAEALAIVYLAKMKKFNPTPCLKWAAQEIIEN